MEKKTPVTTVIPPDNSEPNKIVPKKKRKEKDVNENRSKIFLRQKREDIENK